LFDLHQIRKYNKKIGEKSEQSNVTNRLNRNIKTKVYESI